MTNPVYIEDMIGVVVQAVTQEVLVSIQENDALVNGKTFIKSINYQFGHKNELIETLIQYDKNPQYKFLKYPLIWLVTDFPENRGQEPGIYADVILNIMILHQSSNTYKSTERLARVFKPVLYPIYNSLMFQLANSSFFNNGVEEKIKHRKWNRYYTGKQGNGGNVANELADFVDGIVIENMDLKALFTC